MGIDSESYLFGKLKNDYADEFPVLIHRSNHNRRKKLPGTYLQQLNQLLAGQMNEGGNVFIIDSIPVPVCEIACEKSSKICREHFETAPDKGYSAANKAYYYSYKLHLVTSAKVSFNQWI